MRTPSLWPGTRAIWRWHFYAGLFCIPMVIVLSLTGLVYLFKPQIDDLIDWRCEHLAAPAVPASPSREVAAALAAVPGSNLVAYELPRTPHSAARVLLTRQGVTVRAYVDPGSLHVLKTVREEWRFERLVFKLHGQLLLGNGGSLFVELVASWTIVMLLTGLCLWWPRGEEARGWGLAGVLYPRLGLRGRSLWRELHAVFGLWASMLVLFLLVSGLPWAYAWGNYLQAARALGGVHAPVTDWQVGHVPARAEIAAPPPMPSMPGMPDMPEMGAAAPASAGPATDALDRVVAAVRPLRLAYPVLVTPPGAGSPNWGAHSDAQDRLQRVSLVLSPDGEVLRRTGYGQHPLIDRLVGFGVAVHEGQLFGWANVVLNAFAATSMLLVSVSGIVMWWRRRPPAVLGAPPGLGAGGATPLLLLPVLFLAVALPMFGLSLILVLLVERLVLRRIPRLATWLGLDRRAALRA